MCVTLSVHHCENNMPEYIDDLEECRKNVENYSALSTYRS